MIPQKMFLKFIILSFIGIDAFFYLHIRSYIYLRICVRFSMLLLYSMVFCCALIFFKKKLFL